MEGMWPWSTLAVAVLLTLHFALWCWESLGGMDGLHVCRWVPSVCLHVLGAYWQLRLPEHLGCSSASQPWFSPGKVSAGSFPKEGQGLLNRGLLCVQVRLGAHSSTTLSKMSAVNSLHLSTASAIPAKSGHLKGDRSRQLAGSEKQ